jgi:PEP-CTERM motif-containing protein
MQQSRTFGAKFARKIDFRRLGALAVLTLGSFSVWSALAPSDSSQIAPAYSSSFLSAAGDQDPQQISLDGNYSARPIYPYSVIPGGVESAAELRNSVTRDPVVAEHYGDFDVARARVVRLDQDRFLYVSYRLGNRVFWSKKRFTIHKGEAVITDGEHMARTRCGNRVADVAAGPMMAVEPDLETAPPATAEALTGAPDFLGASPFAPGDVALTPPPTSGISSGGSSGGGIGSPGAPVGGGGGPPSHGVTPPVTPPIPPIPAPEPETLLMLAAGFTGIWFSRKKWKS